MLTTVKQLLAKKGKTVWTVHPDTTVYEAIELMADKNIGSVLVVEKDGSLCGIMSERDYVRKIAIQGKSSRTTPVSDIMTNRVLVVSPNESINRCMSLMTDKHLRHLPVMDGDKIVGVISIGDVVKAVIDDQEFMLGQLETYITGPKSGG